MSTLPDWRAGVIERHHAAAAAGLHDDECEWTAQGFWICHCSKRRRLAAGKTDLPSEDLYFPPPDCVSCGGELEYDGDTWSCHPCALAWGSNGAASSARFTDDHGDISRCAVHGIRAHHICQTTSTTAGVPA